MLQKVLPYCMCVVCVETCEIYTSNATNLVSFHAFNMLNIYHLVNMSQCIFFFPYAIWSAEERGNVSHRLSHCCVSAQNFLSEPGTVRVKFKN